MFQKLRQILFNFFTSSKLGQENQELTQENKQLKLDNKELMLRITAIITRND